MTPGHLKVHRFFHNAHISVDEKGTVAAAATVEMGSGSGGAPIEGEFRADHPFLFLIRERASGALLFLGRIVDP